MQYKDLDNRYTIIKTVDRYPGRRNTYQVNVEDINGNSHISDYMDIGEYNVIKQLQTLKYQLPAKELKALCDSIEDYADSRVHEAQDGWDMDAAEADL